MCQVYANLAIAITKAKYKCKLIKAISKLITKIGNLGLKIDMQSVRQNKLGTVTRKPPNGLF
jgi:hypothetical protein